MSPEASVSLVVGRPSLTKIGTFFGVGVGPGPSGYLPVAAWHALKGSDVILTPRSRSAEFSVAKQCLAGLGLDESKFREVLYNMDPDQETVSTHYTSLARDIAKELSKGSNVAYIMIGDTLTYSTYGDTLTALRKLVPDLRHRTFPGITSYGATASAFDWSLGQGKERILILPCPEEMNELRNDIETHDIVVLMQIGRRLNQVLKLLEDLNIKEHCVLASRIGLPGEVLCDDLSDVTEPDLLGYLSTMLIRKRPIQDS